MSLRPPSSPSPDNGGGNKNNRQSMGPNPRGSLGLPQQSPRPGARPTSELLAGGSGSGMFQTPEAEALDQWFENLQSYEVTLEEMAAASLDVNFKEELSAIEQWFKVLSEAERTAALYSLLQHSTQVQIRFFITVLQQMARSDPMTALLSPGPGGSMQSQMEAKLASLKSPGLKSSFPSSPTGRNFSGSAMRQSVIPEASTNFLSPDSAAMSNHAKEEAAVTLATQRAKFKASNAAHRISAPVFASTGPDGKINWGPGSLAEQQPIEEVVNSGSNSGNSRPKSTEFSGSRGASASNSGNNEVTIPAGDSWASMVQTPLIPMFGKKTAAPAPEPARAGGDDWNSNSNGGVPRMGDPTIHRRTPKSSPSPNNDLGGIYDENGNMMGGNGQQRSASGNYRNPNNNGNNNNGNNGANGGNNFGGWSGARSPALSNTSSNRFGGMGGSDDGSGNLNGLGMPIGGFGGMGMGGGMGSPNLGGLGMPNIGAPGMAPPFNMQNMNNMAMLMGISPDALLAAQMAAAGQLGQPNWMAMQQAGMNAGGQRRPTNNNNANNNNNNRNAPGNNAANKGVGATPKAEEDVDPTMLHDIPGWLRSLRLHKYTPNFEGEKWQDMVLMDEAALEAKGVAALGARRKMLKTFELVRKKMGIEEPQSSSGATSTSS